MIEQSDYTASFTVGATKMPKNKTALAGLIVLCLTFLCGLWLVRDTLCEVRYQDGNTSFLAHFVVYEAVN